ncbi:MAG: hypothetical protein GY898_23840 [Proteobacteria bacterium]|nr:hypothetical protein [Pseudomonadota bacterium]
MKAWAAAATGVLIGTAAWAFEPATAIITIGDASGPPVHPTCREALDLPPPEEPATPPSVSESPTPSVTTPTEAPTPPDHPAAHPEDLPLVPLEGPAEVLASIAAVFERGDTGERIRLSFYGASHTSADWWTGKIRRELQDRWGDLGHGFILPAALYSGYRGQDVNLCRSSGWRSDWAGKRSGRGDGLLGFAGMSVSSGDHADFGWLQTTRENPHGRNVETVDVFTLGQPEGGTLRIQVDQTRLREVPTNVPGPSLQRTRVQLPDGPHRITVAPAGDGEVRIFGASMERAGGGALVDAMGIRGRQARDWLAWEPTMLSAGLQALDPDLVVLAYGTNEAANSKYTMEEYREELTAVLTRLREARPTTACILVGPSDRTKKYRGRWSTWSRTEPVAQVQREVAPQFGCAFWDWQQVSGGPGSMRAWQQIEPRLASRDGIHFTKAGYEYSADRFLAAIDALSEDDASTDVTGTGDPTYPGP